jgi:hypothetical protein
MSPAYEEAPGRRAPGLAPPSARSGEFRCTFFPCGSRSAGGCTDTRNARRRPGCFSQASGGRSGDPNDGRTVTRKLLPWPSSSLSKNTVSSSRHRPTVQNGCSGRMRRNRNLRTRCARHGLQSFHRPPSRRDPPPLIQLLRPTARRTGLTVLTGRNEIGGAHLMWSKLNEPTLTFDFVYV